MTALNPVAAYTYTPFPRNVLAGHGDSITYNGTLGVTADNFWPNQLMKLIVAPGTTKQFFACRARNFGKSGDTSGNGLARVGQLTLFEIPNIAVIFFGTNDVNKATTVAASPAPTNTTFTVGNAGFGPGYPVGTRVFINGNPTTITGQNSDALTFAPTAAIGTPTTGQTVTIDTTSTLVALGNAILASGCPNIMIVGQPYLNYSVNGDTPTVQQAAAQALRATQKAAANLLGCPYVDLYAFCQARINAGTDTQGSFTYHVLDQNIHPSAYGSSVMAQAMYAALPQSWLIPVGSAS